MFPSAQSNDGNSDGDIEREENEDVWCTNWIWWGDVLPARSVTSPVDSVLHPLEVIGSDDFNRILKRNLTKWDRTVSESNWVWS